MKPHTLFTPIALLALSCAVAAAQPTDNPAKTQYGDGNYPVWTDTINWTNVVDVTSDPGLATKAVANDPSAGAQNLAAFNEAVDDLHAAGGGVMFWPAGTYHFTLPDAGYGPGIGPNSRGLMLKEGIVVRGDGLIGANAIIRNPDNAKLVDYDLQPSTIFVFPFQKRGTVPAGATGVDGEPAGTEHAAGLAPTDWSFIGLSAEGQPRGVSDVDNVGVVNVALYGGTIVFGFDSEWATHMGANGVKWEGNLFKVDWPDGSAATSDDWIHRVPNGEHYGDLINGRTGWTKPVWAGSGRLVLNTKILNGASWMDFIYADRRGASTTQTVKEAFAHYRFAGRIIAYGSNIFIANNVLAKPTRNFVHDQIQDAGMRTILFDYANHLGIDINKSLLGGNQSSATVQDLDGQGYFADNIVVRDNWVFCRGNKGFEISGQYVVIQNNHNERYVASNGFPPNYITNPEAYPGGPFIAPQGVPIALSGTDVDLTFDTVTGQKYEVMVSYDGMQTWFPKPGTPVTGSGSPATVSHAGAAPVSGNKVFYRVRAFDDVDIDAGGISFDGFRWQSSETSSDYLSRGYDLGGMDVWVDQCTVINTGSRGNDGEAILGQRHNNVEVLSWAITNSEFGPQLIDTFNSSSSGANAGYIGPYDMHVCGLFLTGNTGPGSIGFLKPASNYMLDGTWFDNFGPQATTASKHSDDWIAPGKADAPHSDPVFAPILSAAPHASGLGVELSWLDSANNELGFRVEKKVGEGDWRIIAWRPRASLNGVAAYPTLALASASGQYNVGSVVHTQWVDFFATDSMDVDYRVVAINQDGAPAGVTASQGVSNVESFTAP